MATTRIRDLRMFSLLSLLAVVTSKSLNFKSELDEHWENFKTIHGKNHVGIEEVKRRQIWEQRVANIIEHNQRADMGLHSYKRGVNKYSDLSHEETSLLRGLDIRQYRRKLVAEFQYGDIGVPESVDWRHDGFVTPVKDQGTCGSCWAFAATGMLETQLRKKTGKLVSLSEQNLVDCVPDDTPGCVDGLIEEALEYIQDQDNIATEDSYPYSASTGFCHHEVNKTAKVKIESLKLIPFGDEEALKYAVALIGPLAISIDARHDSFLDYKTGIYDEPACGNGNLYLNHGALLVGYGMENGVDYWLVKNSWGTSFGIDGYIKMSRNKNNQCGIASKAIYPVMA